MSAIIKILKFEEGWRSFPYYCSNDYPTVGYGFKIGDKGDPLPKFSLPREAGEAWLNVIAETYSRTVLNYYGPLSEIRTAVLASMAYQLGLGGLMKFKLTNELIKSGQYQAASGEMLNSVWAREDSPMRAKRHSIMFSTDKLLEIYEA